MTTDQATILDELGSVGVRMAEREAGLGELRRRRDELVAQALAAGIPQRRIAEAAGLNKSRVGQIAAELAQR